VQRAIGPWEEEVRDYLALRSRLGYTLRSTGEELLLFARHLDDSGYRGPLTAEIAIRWAKLPTNAKPEYWAWRLGAVRLFVNHLTATDPRHEAPLVDALGRTYARRSPHIYSDEEIAALIDATRMIKPTNALPPHTFRAFFGLLAAVGMRCGEALALQRDHVDLVGGRLLILKGKLGKIRELPLHPSTVDALRAYAERRDTIFRRGRKSEAFFLSRRATALDYQRVTVTFRQLRRHLGWNSDPLPRVHDLRHTFAVRTLLRWCRAGDDVDGKIISLTAYMGHVHVTSTYWYLTAVPELMAISATRFEAYATSGASS
jgi:integrase